MDRYELLHSALAVRQLGLILKEVPQGTESYLDNALNTALHQLRQAVRTSDGSYSEVRALLSDHVERYSGLDYSGALTYNYTKKSGRSSSDSTAFVARTAQGGGGVFHERLDLMGGLGRMVAGGRQTCHGTVQ